MPHCNTVRTRAKLSSEPPKLVSIKKSHYVSQMKLIVQTERTRKKNSNQQKLSHTVYIHSHSHLNDNIHVKSLKQKHNNNVLKPNCGADINVRSRKKKMLLSE